MKINTMSLKKRKWKKWKKKKKKGARLFVCTRVFMNMNEGPLRLVLFPSPPCSGNGYNQLLEFLNKSSQSKCCSDKFNNCHSDERHLNFSVLFHLNVHVQLLNFQQLAFHKWCCQPCVRAGVEYRERVFLESFLLLLHTVFLFLSVWEAAKSSFFFN